MSAGKKRSGFQITSVTSDFGQTPASQSAAQLLLGLNQSESSSHGSSSQPTTPSLKRKYVSHDASGSRFRVVRVAMGGASAGRGLSYRRGRWTCQDVTEEKRGRGFRRVMDSMRHAHSLESLELIGHDSEKGGVHSGDTAHLLAHPVRSGPPSPTHQEPISIRLFDREEPMRAQDLHSTPLPPSPHLHYAPPPLRLDVNTAGRSILRLSHSQPNSPPSGLYHCAPSDHHTAASFRLDQTIFNLTGAASSSLLPPSSIDNKIEQAMDLVKSHLMMAVKEEVEFLKEQIRALQERNHNLERENHILRELTHNTQTRLHHNGP